MAMTFATNIEADGNNTRKVGTATNKFILNDTGNCAAFYGTCATAQATAQKAVTCAEFTDTNLVAGTTIRVKFTYSNTKANPTLKINGGTAKTICCYGTTAPSTTVATSWNAGAVVSFTYDGTNWMMNDWLNTDGLVDQAAVVTTNGEYSLLHAQNTGTAARNGYSVYKSSATINPSTGQITMKGKPVMIGEYSESTAPASPVTGQLWLKKATTSVEESKVLVISTTASSLPVTVNNASITADMGVIKGDVSDPSKQATPITVSTADGSATLSGRITGAVTITMWLAHTR